MRPACAAQAGGSRYYCCNSAGSVLLSSAQICVICGNFGCNEAQIEKESQYAQFEARAESCPERCASQIENLRSCVRTTHGTNALGEIYFCDFPAPNLRNSHPN